MTLFLKICWFLFFSKLLFFWLWLWQLKEYHWGRFQAHFHQQALRKTLSSLWRIKYPKFTLKIIVVLLSSFFLEGILLYYFPLISVIVLTFLIFPFLILSFQIPSVIWRYLVIFRATKKRLKFKDLLVIGITGSYGKTSTKELLAQVLSTKFKVLKTKEHRNSEIGISQCILKELEEGVEVFIVEMAAYNKGGIKLLAKIVKPKIAIVTGVNEQHLATFGTLANLLSAEGGEELVAHLPQDGLALFNANNHYCRQLYEKTIKSGLRAILYGQEASFTGEENLFGVIALAQELGLSDSKIKEGLAGVKNEFPGIEIKKGVNGLTIVDASYSANPTGVIAHLDYLSSRYPSVKRIMVMPCLIELAEASARVHREIAQRVKEVFDLAIVTTKDNFQEMKEVAGDKVVLLEEVEDIISKIKEVTSPGDLILLEGRVPSRLVKELMK